LKQRADDQPATVRTRLEVYENETRPLVEYYRRNGVLQNIDASGTPDKVFALIEKAVGKVAA
jgi:adenylate kinase